MRSKLRAVVCLLLAAPCLALPLRAVADQAGEAPTAMVRVPAGTYRPFFKEAADAQPRPEPVAAFRLDVHPVTVGQFLVFLRENPEWRRSQAPRVFVDTRYLKSWAGDLLPGESLPRDAPVTEVSWFAARAYCRAQGKRLPTTAEWEHAAREEGEAARETNRRVLEWYARPSTGVPVRVAQGPANQHGLHDMHALVWEWVLDFNESMTVGDKRKTQGLDASLFCGSGGALASDPSDYVTFMRHGMRNSLQARYTVRSLGFRCAADLEN